MTSRDLMLGAAGAVAIWFVVERWRRRSLVAVVSAGEVAPAIAVGEHSDDDGPESDDSPCCAKCASSSSSFWRGCDGAGDVITGGKVILPGPPIATKPGPPILSRTGAEFARYGLAG